MLRERLERRGLKPILGALRLFASPSVKLGLLPFGTEAGIAFEERAGQRTAVALVKQASGTLNIAPDGHEELWTLLSSAEVESIVADLKRDQAFATFEKNLASQGWRLQLAQSVGVQAPDKGLLYLAVNKDLSARSSIEYYRIQVSRSGGTYRMVAGTQRALCNQGDAQVLGMPVGAVMSPVGAYGAELQMGPVQMCLMGLGVLGCLDSKIVLRNGDKTLSYRVIAQDDVPFTELIFEPSSPQSLRFLYQFDRNRKEVIATLESWRGDRLQAIVKILQAPNELDCPVLLPSDFTDDQKIREVYQCLIDAGVRVEMKLQFNDYNVTLPALLSDDRDYAAAEQAIRQIASRVDPSLKEAMKSFAAAFTQDQIAQSLGQCFLQSTQRDTGRMTPLRDSDRALNCLLCAGGIAGIVFLWKSLLSVAADLTAAVAGEWIIKHTILWPLSLTGTIRSCKGCLGGGGGGGRQRMQ